jgi:uncharacterized protein (TIGR01777 family)
MSIQVFERSVELPVPAAEAFAWHERPGAFERLSPPWMRIKILHRSGTIHDGDRVTLRMLIGPLPITWDIVHRSFVADREFCDEQVNGPFKSWRHCHRVEPLDAQHSRLTDRIDYEISLGALGNALMARRIARQLALLFDYRHDLMQSDLQLHARFPVPRLVIAMTGASGLIGRHLSAMLTTGGHRVLQLVRRTNGGDGIVWDPAVGILEPERLANIDAVVHLAGENVAGLWTAAKMKRIHDSRVIGTRVLCESLAKLAHKPRTLICASAVGYYGSRGEELLDESSRRGEGFLPEVCEQWESAADAARAAGIRVAHLRLGIVLTPAGGALAAMLPAFKLGLAGVLGPGTQWLPWVGLDDAISAFYTALMDDRVSGVLNVVAPVPVTNRQFTRTLGRVLHRPTALTVPTFVLKATGRMGREMLLASQRVALGKLNAVGFCFRDPELEPMLHRVIGGG